MEWSRYSSNAHHMSLRSSKWTSSRPHGMVQLSMVQLTLIISVCISTASQTCSNRAFLIGCKFACLYRSRRPWMAFETFSGMLEISSSKHDINFGDIWNLLSETAYHVNSYEINNLFLFKVGHVRHSFLKSLEPCLWVKPVWMAAPPPPPFSAIIEAEQHS